MQGGKITDPSGQTFTWNSTRTRTWTSGYNDGNASNDEIDVTGSANGVNRNGKAFSATILNAIHMTAACRYPTRGTVKITRDGLLDRTIDFGTGACDGTATVTVNGVTKTINLPRH